MIRRHIATVIGAAMLATSVAGQQPAAAPPAGTPAKTVKDVMLLFTVPGSDAVFKAAAEPPVTAADWSELQRKAAMLVESAELLLDPKYAVKDNAWRTLAQSHRAAAVATQKAVEKKDADALSAASDALYEECANCHARFLKD